MAARIDVIDLSGIAHVRGVSLGSKRRAQVRACVSDWLRSLKSAGVADPGRYLSQLLKDTDFLTAIRKHTPDLLEEVVGTAEAAGQPFEVLLTSQFMDEEWAYRPSYLSRGEATQKCSSVGIVAHPGAAVVGQNMDLGGYTDGHQVVLRIAPNEQEQGALVFTIGGMIGLMGVNARGVGVCVNSLPQLPHASEGVPVAFVIRKLLQARTAEEAAQTVQSIPHATGQHYLIVGPSSVRSFEASPAGVAEYRSPDPSRVMHTNHPLAEQKGVTYTPRDQTNTVARLECLTNRLMQGDPDIEAVKAALSASDNPEHPVCRVKKPNGHASAVTGMISFTTGSMVSSLRAGAKTVDSWISAGPPCERGYTQIQLTAAR